MIRFIAALSADFHQVKLCFANCKDTVSVQGLLIHSIDKVLCGTIYWTIGNVWGHQILEWRHGPFGMLERD